MLTFSLPWPPNRWPLEAQRTPLAGVATQRLFASAPLHLHCGQRHWTFLPSPLIVLLPISPSRIAHELERCRRCWFLLVALLLVAMAVPQCPLLIFDSRTVALGHLLAHVARPFPLALMELKWLLFLR